MRGIRLATAILCVGALCGGAAAQESASFRLDRVTVLGGASRAQSPSFETRASAALTEPAAMTGVCGGFKRSAFGFWSVLGTLAPPIRLMASRNQAVTGDVDLVWSGSVDTFQLYRGFAASAILSPGNLFLEQSTCAATDTLSTAAPIVFYNVVEKP